MFYGDWANFCLATSIDGKTFTRRSNPGGQPQLDVAGAIDRTRNTRDPSTDRESAFATRDAPAVLSP
jgi:hypothetical protein